MTHTWPVCLVTTPSAWAPLTVCASRRTTWAPCTWFSQAGSAGSAKATAIRRRFSATACGSSCTWAPTFNDAQGPTLTPPPRSVKSARTVSGAGQSGRSAHGPEGPGLTPDTGMGSGGGAGRGAVVGRQGRLPGQCRAGDGVLKSQLRGMQRLAAEGIEGRPQFIRGARRIAPARAVHRVPDHRVTDMRQVHADLVGT